MKNFAIGNNGQMANLMKQAEAMQKQLEKTDEAFKTVANWANVDIDQLREVLKKLKSSHKEEEKENLDTGETQEGRYDILQNAAGEILIIIKYHEGDPDNPRIVYDGTETALLYRSKESAVLLEHINLKAREQLMKVENVLIVEVKDDDVAREYKVPMRKIRSLKSLY